jgi:hypothetical protein
MQEPKEKWAREGSDYRTFAQHPVKGSDVNRVLGVLKGIWAREGLDYRTFAQHPVKGSDVNPFVK